MYFSGKITNSTLAFLSRNSIDLEGLYEFTEIPTEFLRDPTCWLDASQVEEFLKTIENEFCSQFTGKNLIEEIGHNARELRAWGVLDSVLKMMLKPQDIYLQPERFISYFISPAPPLGGLDRGKESVSFDLPLTPDEYPFVTTYLRAAFEALPTFMQQDMARARWDHTQVSVSWSKNQTPLFTDSDQKRNFDPTFMQTLINNVESAEQEIERLRAELKHKEHLLQSLPSENPQSRPAAAPAKPEFSAELEPVLKEIQGQFMRLIDYQTRAQQLVTLLAASQEKNGKTAKEAMHRVDWDYVKEEFAGVVEKGVENLRWVRETLSENSVKKPQKPSSRSKQKQSSLFEDVGPLR